MKIDQPQLADLHAYWDRKRAGRRAPRRRDIDPIEIPNLLPNLFICDVTAAPRSYRMALFGTALVTTLGKDLTNEGAGLVCLRDPGSTIRRDYDRAVDRCEPVISNLDAGWIGRDFLHYVRLLLPLSDDGVSVNKLVGAIHFTSDRG